MHTLAATSDTLWARSLPALPAYGVFPGDFSGVSYWLVAAPCLHSPCEQICPLSLAFSCCFHRGGMLLETLYHQHIIDTVRDGPKHSPHSPHPPAPWPLTTVCRRDRSGRYQRMDALGLLHKEWRLCVPQTKESSLTFPEEHPVCLLQPGLLARAGRPLPCNRGTGS